MTTGPVLFAGTLPAEYSHLNLIHTHFYTNNFSGISTACRWTQARFARAGLESGAWRIAQCPLDAFHAGMLPRTWANMSGLIEFDSSQNSWTGALGMPIVVQWARLPNEPWPCHCLPENLSSGDHRDFAASMVESAQFGVAGHLQQLPDRCAVPGWR